MTVYALNCYDETESHPRLDFYELFETEELATKRLRHYTDEIKTGRWSDCTFLEWHDADDNEVTWMLYSRKNFADGTETKVRITGSSRGTPKAFRTYS